MKKILFCLLMAGIAICGSAFRNAGKYDLGSYLVQTSAGVYRESDGTGSCITPASLPCIYTVQFPNSIPDRGATGSYTPAEISSYVSSGWLVQGPSLTNRIYVP